MYAERKSWPLAGVDVKLTYIVADRDTRWIDRLITLHGVDDEADRHVWDPILVAARQAAAAVRQTGADRSP